MDELGLGGVGGDGGDGADVGLVHDDGVALDVAEALGVAHHLGIEDLGGGALGNRPGDDSPLGPLAVELDDHVALGVLLPMGQEALRHHGLGPLAADDLRLAEGGVDAPDLGGLHGDGSALLQVDHRLRVHDPAAGAVALAVVLLGVLHVGVLAHVEGVEAVVAALLAAAVVDAAAGHDVHIAVLADVEIVVDHLLDAWLCDDDGDVALLAPRSVFHPDVDAGLAVRLAGDLDVFRGLAAVTAAVLADVEGPHGLSDEVRDLFQ